MKKSKSAEVHAWTQSGPVYSPTSLEDIKNINLLKSACRTKHLFLANKPQLLRSIYSFMFGKKNRIDYRIDKASTIPSNFIRQEPWEIEYLYMLSNYSKVGILETGRFNGGSTLVSSLANKLVPIHSIDFDPKDDDFLNELFSLLNVGANVNLIIGDSQKTKYESIEDIDLLFVDADHSKEGCFNDMTNWWDNLIPGGSLLLHDCYFGCEVQEAVLKFINNYDVEVVISPYKSHEHRRYPQGSFCHLLKR